MPPRSLVRILGRIAVALFSILGIIFLLARALPLAGIMLVLAAISFALLKAIGGIMDKFDRSGGEDKASTVSTALPSVSGSAPRPEPFSWPVALIAAIAGFSLVMLVRDNAPEWTWAAVAFPALAWLGFVTVKNRKQGRKELSDVLAKKSKSGSALSDELITKAADIIRRLDAIADSIPDPKLRQLADVLVMNAIVFLRQAKANPTHVVKQQRFVNYYLPQATSILERCESVARHPAAHKEELPKIETAMQELGPVFAHYSSAISRDEAVNMDLELRLLRSSIREDMIDPPAAS